MWSTPNILIRTESYDTQRHWSWMGGLGFNLWDELRLAVREGATPLPTPRDAMRLATVGSARVLGLDHLIATLEEGKKADFIVVHAPRWEPSEGDDALYARLIDETLPQHVRHVAVGGQILKSL